MAKTSELNELTTGVITGIAQNDLIQVVDVSDKITMREGAGTNKRITLLNFARGLITTDVVEAKIPFGTAGQYYSGEKTWENLNRAAVGLSKVANLSVAEMFTNPVFTVTATLPSETSIGDVSSSEISYLNNVTSNIQDQLNEKQGIVLGVTDVEIGYLFESTGNIQTQINARQIVITGAASTITENDLDPNLVLVSNSAGKVSASEVTTGELNQLSGITNNIQSQLELTKSATLILTDQSLNLSMAHYNAYIKCQHTVSTTFIVPNQTQVDWLEESTIYFRRDSAAGPIYIEIGSGVVVNGQAITPTILANQNFALRRVGLNVWDVI